MNSSEVVVLLKDNVPLIILIFSVLIIWLAKQMDKRRKGRIQTDQEIPKKIEPFNTIYLKKDFTRLNFADKNFEDNISKQLEFLDNELIKYKQEAEKLEQQYDEIVELNEKIKMHTYMLMEQRTLYIQMKERLAKNDTSRNNTISQT